MAEIDLKTQFELIIRNAAVLLPDLKVMHGATLGIKLDRIARIETDKTAARVMAGKAEIGGTHKLVMPG